MSDPAAPDAGRLIPWLLGGVGTVVAALWAAFRGASAKNEARLEAELARERAERERERKDAKEALDRLGEKLDAERSAHERTRMMAARALLQARSDPRRCEPWEAEAPTGVHHLLGVATSDPFPELKDWDPTKSDRPGARGA